ncbi:exonuclease II Exo2 [Coemansia sp. RSA 2711]|nr:exonuclease II Exo2 [Coemansia sp. RSA 2711]
MGVPGLWRWLLQLYPAACRTTAFVDLAPVHALYVDLNSTIHRSARQANGDAAAVLQAIDVLVARVQPQRLLFLAIDGVPPRLKERLQRQRRARPEDDGSEFNAYFVTPGAAWLRHLEERIRQHVSRRSWPGLRVVLSGCSDPGEGEQKIIEHVRCCKGGQGAQTTSVVWSNDADAVLLALASHAPRVTVVAEHTHGTNSSYRTVDIDGLRSQLIERYAPPTAPTQLAPGRVIDDLVLMALLAGNDFLPPLLASLPADDALDTLWSLYTRYLTKHPQHLHDRGRINTHAFANLLRMMEHEHEDRMFRRYVGATPLGSHLTAMRARRLEWDRQREAPSGAQHPAPLENGNHDGWQRKPPRQKKGTKKARKRTRPSTALGGRCIPHVWTGSIDDVADPLPLAVALMPGAAPLAAGLFPQYRPPSKCGGAALLELDGCPLLATDMLPALRWIIDTAGRPACTAALAGSDGFVGYSKITWLRAVAAARGLHLDAFDMSDPEFDALHKRWLRTRLLDAQAPTAATWLQAEASSSSSSARPAQILVLERRPEPPAEPLAATETRVAVVDSGDWDVLLADATTEHQRRLKLADWKQSYYWPRSCKPGCLSSLYADALGWTAQYFFSGTVASWVFQWPADLDAPQSGQAPLPSDLLEHVLGMGDEWTSVPRSDAPPPLLLEHMLSVVPPDAWVAMEDENRALAQQLRDSHYTDDTHAAVRARLAATAEDAPLVSIWI